MFSRDSAHNAGALLGSQFWDKDRGVGVGSIRTQIYDV